MSLVGLSETVSRPQPQTVLPALRVRLRRRLATLEAVTTIVWALSPLIAAAVAAVS